MSHFLKTCRTSSSLASPLSSSLRLHLSPFRCLNIFSLLPSSFSLFQILPLFFCSSFSPLYSSPSFSLLVSQLQMSYPSTPPQAVSGIVYKCDALRVWRRSGVCKKVRKTVSVKIKGSINVSQIMCMHVTVSSFHLWLSASPHTSLGKLCRSHCWQIWGVMVKETAAAKPTRRRFAETCHPRPCESLGQAFP